MGQVRLRMAKGNEILKMGRLPGLSACGNQGENICDKKTLVAHSASLILIRS